VILELLLWLGLLWAVFLAYCASDAPTLLARAAHHLADRLWGDAR
jgi:hypothetical protein